ncbi:MAG: hypothetical protein IT258_06370 [Saprospiraceae bacterium]|nr:hypothetical protein [Saprospiraceae bacterium]
MKKFLLFSFLALFFTVAFQHDAFAQKKGKKKSSKTDEYFDDSGFANKLWYGGNFNLGFAGGNTQSQFVFGLSPMVGYKLLNDVVSLGPRVGFELNKIKVSACVGCPVFKSSPISYNMGVFARVKPFQNFFGHVEYEYQNAESVDPDGDNQIEIDNKGNIITGRLSYNNVYVGAGYTSGGLWGYEFLVLYNVNQPAESFASPLIYRVGITHKF